MSKNRVWTSDGKWSEEVIDKTGRVVIRQAWAEFSEGLAHDLRGNKSGFGKYEYVPPTEPVKRGASKDAGKRGRYEYLALASLTLVIFFGLCYNVYALVVHSTRHALWENIAGVVVCAVLLVICGATLYYSREK